MNEIWSYGRGYYKIYVEDFSKVPKLSSWAKVESCNHYYTKLGYLFVRDLVFPASIHNRVATLFGLKKKKKSAGRVKEGKRSNTHLGFSRG